MELDSKSTTYLDKLLNTTKDSFDGLSARWDELQPSEEFYIKISEDFHLGFVFGKIEDSFIQWFYSNYGRSMTDKEYYHFWKKCRDHIREIHKKYDSFYFQE